MTPESTQILAIVENKRKVGVIGGALKDYWFYKQAVNKYAANVENMCIVSAGHYGIKVCNAEHYAEEYDIPSLIVYKTQDMDFGELYTRVLEASDMLVIFYDGKSWTVWNIIQECVKWDKPHRIIKI